MPAPKEILDLCERYTAHRDSYESGHYNETQLRREFLDPFFVALGWDVDNKDGYAEAYKEVIHEDAIKIGGATKAPDYCFRVGGIRKFFVEAKKPSVNIKGAASPAYQLRRYAWSAKLPLSILSDFGEFAAYDCRIRPSATDGPTVGRTHYLGFEDYAQKWDEIAAIFSKEAILKGAFDKFATIARGRRGTVEVDAAFLNDIEEWREALARNIALRNRDLTQREINFSVGRIIDRIIFVRICEDRGIEPEGSLRRILDGENIYSRLCEKFYEADQRYNSGLFHFEKEKDRAELPDNLTPHLTVDDKVLKDVRKRLYLPDSPYEFSVLPADILGQVYEQFLGKVIALTKGHRAHVEDKPEVKKAGGVYYTPTHIVHYIVQNTLGRMLEKSCSGRSVTADDVSELRLLDPACGSGSFLIAAYQFLLDWHRDYYTKGGAEKHARGRNPKLYRAITGEWRLAATERKRILLNNIYGVDIDAQAVEVTKLSLLLKVLEGESDESLSRQLKFLHERALPDLGNNIKCGNSLIGPEFYDQQELMLLNEDEQYRINVFDWRREFATIVKRGGFDIIVGNPPYIRIQALKEWAPIEVDYYKKFYQSAARGNYDIYVVFVERALSLLNDSGELGYILPHKFFNAEYGEPIRVILSQSRAVRAIVHFGHQQVFDHATTYTCLLFLSKSRNESFTVNLVSDMGSWRLSRDSISGELPIRSLGAAYWNLNVGRGSDLVERMKGMPTTLRQCADIFVGLQTSADDVFVLQPHARARTGAHLYSKSLEQECVLERDLLHPLLSGPDVNRFILGPDRQFILFPYEVSQERARLLTFAEIQQNYPKTAKYLLLNRDTLEKREDGKFHDERWYRFGRSQNLGIQGRKKICIPRLVTHLYAAYDGGGRWFLDNVDVGGVTPKKTNDEAALLSVLALLNSDLLRWYFPFVSAPFRGGWLSANRQFLGQLPIASAFYSESHGDAAASELAYITQSLLDLHGRLAAVKTDQDRTTVHRQITASDRKLNAVVFKAYGLTDAEIAQVKDMLAQQETESR